MPEKFAMPVLQILRRTNGDIFHGLEEQISEVSKKCNRWCSTACPIQSEAQAEGCLPIGRRLFAHNWQKLLSQILPLDQETLDFYRGGHIQEKELEEIIRKKSGIISTANLIPLERGTSGRIFKLKIEVLNDRLSSVKNWNSPLAIGEPSFKQRFLVSKDERAMFCESFTHGVAGARCGLCQIGAQSWQTRI